MSFLVATNVVASRLPERRPTGTPHACAKSVDQTDLHPPRSPCRTRIKCEDGYIPANWWLVKVCSILEDSSLLVTQLSSAVFPGHINTDTIAQQDKGVGVLKYYSSTCCWY